MNLLGNNFAVQFLIEHGDIDQFGKKIKIPHTFFPLKQKVNLLALIVLNKWH